MLASTDIYHFLLMFTVLLSSFALIATAYFGENLHQFSDLFTSLVQLVKMMSTAFDSRIFTTTPQHALFLVLFTVTFNLLMLNLLTSIIIVHYLDYRRDMKELFRMRADLERDRSFIEVMLEQVIWFVAPSSMDEEGSKECSKRWFRWVHGALRRVVL